MSHGHQAVHNEPRAPQYPYVTQVVTQVVTAPAPAQSANNWSYSQQPTYRVGPPVAPTQAAPSSAPKPTPVYHAPVRHQRPPKEPKGGNYHAPIRHQRPEPTAKKPPVRHQRPQHPPNSAGIRPPVKTHHSLGEPILHDKTSAAVPTITNVPTSDGSSKHNQGQVSPNKVTTDEGMSGGAKAGLAIGILLIIGLIAGLAFLIYRKKKKNENENHQPLDDEKTDLHKSNSVSSHVSVRRTVANAPRLSLRPVTEMFPEKQDSQAASTMIANSAASARSKTPEPPRPANNLDEKSNPFGDHAAAPATTSDEAMVAAPAAAVPKPLSIKSERTGTGISEGSVSSDGQTAAGAGAAPNGRRMSPPGPGPNNVHRVQLDFNPSMDDELGLRAGQLVRMLHEYDDGWALCVRLDRSQQGVVPRTCLSKLPVKPRPQGPPQGMRGPPQGRPRGPTNGPAPGAGPRMPPNGRNRSQSNSPRHQRPESPANARMGGPGARPRANSDAMSARRVTPPNLSTSPVSAASTSPTQTGAVPNRKPVPGQAM